MSFDILAPIYRGMEAVLAGKKLQRCRVAFLEEIPQPDRVLLLGEGHGRFLLALRQRFPEARILQIDASAGMLRQSQIQLAKAGLQDDKVSFVHQDILDWTPGQERFALIVTHFFLDCFRPEQIAVLAPRIAAAADPCATWLLADFQVAASGWKRVRSQAILALMYAFFRVVTRLPAKRLTDPGPFLEKAGFTLVERREFDWGLLKSDRWQKSA